MNKHGHLLYAILCFCGLALAANKDPQNFPKGQLLSAPPVAPLSSSAALNAQALFHHSFNESSDGWTLTGGWQLRHIPSPAGAAAVLASTLEPGYRPQTDSRTFGPLIQLPAIDPRYQKLILSLKEKYEIESVYDQGYLELSADNGVTWVTVHGRSGVSDWRETAVDVSQFSGATVRLAFRLATDPSDEFAGWQIESIDFKLQEIAQLSASLVSLNAQGFPFIYMNVAVNSGSSLLGQSNFTVYENGVLQTNYFQVTPPQSGSGSRLSDIVFLMDNSGSMSDDQAAVYNNVTQFVDNLAASQVNYALGLCRFGMSAGGGNPVIENSGQFTQDANYFKNGMWARNTVDGSREPGYDAVVQSSSGFSFRPGAQKVFILITDERPNQGSSTVNDVLNACTSGSITLFVLTIAELNSYFTSLTSATNGAIFDIHANFNTILNYISSQVSNNYVVQYRTSNPVADGVERRVETRISWNSEQASVFGSYIPGAVPQIIRTAATIALEQQAWAAGSPLTIEIEAIDLFAPYVSTVRLYCRTTGSSFYQSVALNQVSSTLWRGQIPYGVVNAPGVDYYLTASDGLTTVSAPAVNPVDLPYQIAILPNYAPVITHTPITQATRGLPLAVTIEARDATNRLATLLLYYKKTGQLTYQSAAFTLVAGSTYRATIPAEYITVGGADYFIKAWDDLGVSSSHGTFDQPHYIAVSGTGGLQPWLLDPVAGKVGMGAEVWLSWEAGTGAVAYRIELDDNSDFLSLKFSRSNVSETRVYVAGLDYETKYYWRVQGKNAQGTTEWSQVYSFTTMSKPPVEITTPSQYVLAYLAVGDQCYTDRNYMLGSTPAALRYNLYIKTANADKNYSVTNYFSFELATEAVIYIAYDERASSPPDWLTSNYIRISNKIEINELNGTLTAMGIWKRTLPPGRHTLGGNLAAGAAGAKTNFLVLFSFGFDPFTPIQIVTPADSARYVTVNPTSFVWRKIPGAQWFDFNLSTATSSSKVIAYDFGLSDTTYRVDNLEINRTYYWRLRASSVDRSTEWTKWFKFTTGMAPVITGLSLAGPPEVNGGSWAEYSCTATWSDGTTTNVTAAAVWSENSNYAEFTAPGRLTAAAVSLDKNLTITVNHAGMSTSMAVKIKYTPIPIVFVPGIMGSPLYDDINDTGHLFDASLSIYNERLWIDPYRLQNGYKQRYLLALQLDVSGEKPLDPYANIKVAPLREDEQNTLEDNLGKLPLSEYKNFFTYFDIKKYQLDDTALPKPDPNTRLFCFTYDWRKSLSWNGENLSAFIDLVLQSTNSTKVNIVAHSMGGLVTKSCVKDFDTARINKIVFVGTPHLGAPKIYYTMLTGDVEFGFFKDFLISNETIRRITENMPSTYQLFPTMEYFDTAIGNGSTDGHLYHCSLIEEDTYHTPPLMEHLGYSGAIQLFKDLPEHNDGLLDLSTAVQNDLKKVEFGTIEFFNIVGMGHPTIGRILIQYDSKHRPDYLPIYNLDGDGTVPLKSAETINGETSNTRKTFYISSSEHTGLASDATVTQIIDGLFKEPAVLPSPQAPEHPYANLDIWQSIIACPVVVHVYDDQGRHTGPTSDSTYAEEIPGSHYIPADLTDPESKKIFLLPYGGSYRFEILSQDTTGVFDFNTYAVLGGSVRRMLSFDSVEFEPSTKAYCHLTAFAKEIGMDVDLDGNGSIDTTYRSSVSLPTGAELEPDIPVRNFALYQNYPNPFNAATRIAFSLPRAEHVTITLYNISGQLIRTLLEQRMEAGNHTLSLNSSDLATGVYLCRLTAGPFSRTIKIALLR
jgi:hypothetical protein